MLTPSKVEAGEMLCPPTPPTLLREPARLADPAPLAMGAFATSLITVSFGMMNFREVSLLNLNVANLLFVACVGLLISAQWEMVRGNTFSYTVLSAYGLFYGGYGFILIPTLDIAKPYGGAASPQYNNAFGFYILMWGIFNVFFLITSTAYNLVYVGIFTALQFCFVLDAASFFVLADGHQNTFYQLQQASGAFALMAGLLGYYTCAHYMCEEALPFRLPMGQLRKRGKIDIKAP